jgi:MoaA/NifB/PqqE/SkfB family radical SAM enzyme
MSPAYTDALRQYNAYRVAVEGALLCYAPFRSMYIGQKGKVSACCFGRTYVLGYVTQNTLLKIRQGENTAKLREALLNNDLSKGCQLCAEQINGHNFENANALHFENYPQNALPYPNLLEFELSNECNLECVMCHGLSSSLIRAKREKLPPLEGHYDDTFIAQLDEFIPHLYEAKFFGGEPFLIDIYLRIWERMVAMNPSIRIAVQTNGTVLNSRTKDLLERGNFNIGVSIDGADKKTYEAIRINGKFEQVIDNLHYFHDYCKRKNTFFGLSACAMQENRYGLATLVRLANSFECSIYFNTVFYPRHSSLKFLDKTELLRTIDFLLKEDLPANTQVQQKNKVHFTNMLKQMQHWAETDVATEEKSQYIYFDTPQALFEFSWQKLRLSKEENKYDLQELREKMGAFFAVIAHRKLPLEIIRLENEDESAFDFMLYMIMTEPAEQIAVMLERMYL